MEKSGLVSYVGKVNMDRGASEALTEESADMSAYSGYPVHGSMALTARGQQVLEQLERTGAIGN